MRQLVFILCLLLLPTIGLTMDWQITTLDNDLKVMILESHQVPQVNISTTIKVGAKNETAILYPALLTHLTISLLYTPFG